MKSLLSIPVRSLSDIQLSEVCTYQHEQYRKGNPVISDEEFDSEHLSALRLRIPGHPLITKPQPTLISSTGLIAHTVNMLSMDKAYTIDDIDKYVELCDKHAEKLGMDTSVLMFRITPKLDGITGNLRKKENLLLTRGKDGFGEDFSLLLGKGIQIIGDNDNENLTGEAVVLSDYFKENILGTYKNPRNYMGSVVSRIIRSRNTNKITDIALNDKAIHFVVFNSLEGLTVDRVSLLYSLEFIAHDLENDCPYLTDGVVIEVVDEELKKSMSHNGSYHLWQIAKKKIGETADTPITDIVK